MEISYREIRILYYVGIALLVANTLPAARKFLSVVFDFEPITGISLITIIAVLTGIGAFLAYKRKLG
jgi:hypothetical protein